MSKDARRKEKAAAEVKTEKSKPEVVKVEVKPAGTDTKAAPKAERMTVAKLTEICRTLAEATKECKETDRDHEDRICKLEKAVFGVKPEPAPEPKVVIKAISESKPEPAPEPKPESKPVAKTVSEPAVREKVDLSYVFRRENGRICRTPNKTAAIQASEGMFKEEYVVYVIDENGFSHINRPATAEDMAKAGLIF